MSKKTTLRHALPCGHVETRTTARAYTHVVICRRDPKAIREQEGRISQLDLNNFAFYEKRIATGVGNHFDFGRGHLSHEPLNQRDIDQATHKIAGCANAQQFAEKCRDLRLAAHDEAWGDAEAGPWMVHGWSSSAQLAEKMAAKCRTAGWCLRDVQVQAINGGEL